MSSPLTDSCSFPSNLMGDMEVPDEFLLLPTFLVDSSQDSDQLNMRIDSPDLNQTNIDFTDITGLLTTETIMDTSDFEFNEDFLKALDITSTNDIEFSLSTENLNHILFKNNFDLTNLDSNEIENQNFPLDEYILDSITPILQTVDISTDNFNFENEKGSLSDDFIENLPTDNELRPTLEDTSYNESFSEIYDFIYALSEEATKIENSSKGMIDLVDVVKTTPISYSMRSNSDLITVTSSSTKSNSTNVLRKDSLQFPIIITTTKSPNYDSQSSSNDVTVNSNFNLTTSTDMSVATCLQNENNITMQPEPSTSSNNTITLNHKNPLQITFTSTTNSCTPTTRTSMFLRYAIAQNKNSVSKSILSKSNGIKKRTIKKNRDYTNIKFGNEVPRIADMKVYRKPPFSYTCLIVLALKNSQTGSMHCKDIYEFICNHFPYYKKTSESWKNSIRSALASRSFFVKIKENVNTLTTKTNKKGTLWTLKVTEIDESYKKLEKDLHTKLTIEIKESMMNPDEFEVLIRGKSNY